MRRVAVTGVFVGLLAVLGACAAGESAGDKAPASQGNVARAPDGPEPDNLRNPTADRRGPLPDGGAASCVEAYAPRAVSKRAFAFDGVVVEVGASVSDRGDEADLGLPGVTFEVGEWFSGGRGDDTVTVDVQPPTTGAENPSDPGYAYGLGSRLLVSGEPRWGGSPLDAPIAWGCGFSRYYDPETAKAWRDTLAR